MMTDQAKQQALENCLVRLQQGADVEQALASYPQWANELRPLLQAAQELTRLGSPGIPAGAANRSHARFLAAAGQRPQRRRLDFRSGWRLALAPIALLLILLLGMGGSAASAQSLPGDLLYPLKLAGENTRLLLTEDQAKRIEIQHAYDHERLEEVESLAQQERRHPVTFAGVLQEIYNGEWMIEGVRVIGSDSTQLVGMVQPGTIVEVQGMLLPDGSVAATVIQPRIFDIQGHLQAVLPGEWVVDGVHIKFADGAALANAPGVGTQEVGVEGALGAASYVARPVLRWNHHRMMAGCIAGLERRFGGSEVSR